MKNLRLLLGAVFLVILASCLAGCLAAPGMQQQSGAAMRAAEALAAKNALEIEQTIDGQTPPMPITVTGTNNVVKVDMNPAAFRKKTSVNSATDQSSMSEIEQEWYQSSKLPWGLSILCFAVGAWLIKMLLKSSQAGRLIARSADEVLSVGIKSVRRLASNATARTDPEGARQLQELVEQMTTDRGKLKVKSNGHSGTF